jgi:Transmembrane amino acid transporter protein
VESGEHHDNHNLSCWQNEKQVTTNPDTGVAMGGPNDDASADPVFCGDVDASMIDHDDDGDGRNGVSAALLGHNHGTNNDDDTADDGDDDDGGAAPRRHGTISSARFNMLSTMVGGGSLSLPLAFAKSGNGLIGPILLLAVALLTEFCFRIHVGSARMLQAPRRARPGNDSFESVTSKALGQHMRLVSMALVTAMCFFGTVGYAVLLRDMLQPITNAVWNHHNHDYNSTTNITMGDEGDAGYSDTNGSGPTLHNNLTMLVVVLIMTPLCALKTLTALQKFGAASMLSVLVLGGCVVYRSVQCNFNLWMSQPSIHGAAAHSLWEAFLVRR